VPANNDSQSRVGVPPAGDFRKGWYVNALTWSWSGYRDREGTGQSGQRAEQRPSVVADNAIVNKHIPSEPSSDGSQQG
jgi:hypothetical protein